MIFAAAPNDTSNHAGVEIFEEIDSTHLEARRRAEAGAFAPVWLLARRQSAGKGRRGRAWASGEGALMASYIGPLSAPPADVAMFGLAVGLAIAEALVAHGAPQAETRLKWPNDVFVSDAKIAGILMDSGATQVGERWLALSFGVNLAAAPEGLDQPAVSLAQATGETPPAPETFLATIRTRLSYWDNIFAVEGFTPVRASWLERAYGLGAVARVALPDGVLEGRFSGLSPRGELELETSAGHRAISAGDVAFAAAPLQSLSG